MLRSSSQHGSSSRVREQVLLEAGEVVLPRNHCAAERATEGERHQEVVNGQDRRPSHGVESITQLPHGPIHEGRRLHAGKLCPEAVRLVAAVCRASLAQPRIDPPIV